jgi:hypothetical protein
MLCCQNFVFVEKYGLAPSSIKMKNNEKQSKQIEKLFIYKKKSSVKAFCDSMSLNWVQKKENRSAHFY